MELNVFDSAGQLARTLPVQDAVFAVPFAQAAVHQAFVRQLANQRQGNHNTLSRGEVRGSTRKLFRQKGTGRARQGSVRAPHRRGGGVAHGPKPRDYRLDMPKKMRRLALKAVLSAKARDGELFVLETLEFAAPKTREMMRILTALGTGKRKTLLVTAGAQRNVVLSARNIPWVYSLPANQINVADLINHRNVILTTDAVAVIESIWGGGAVTTPAPDSAGDSVPPPDGETEPTAEQV